MASLSKRKLAQAFLKLRSTRSHGDAVRALAAALRESRLTHDVELIVREVARAALSHGELVVSVTLAHAVSDTYKTLLSRWLKQLAHVEKVSVDYHIDPALIGGFVITTPLGVVDASIAGRLNRLR